MKIEINVEKKAVIMIVTALVLMIGILAVVAQEKKFTPNQGAFHSVRQLSLDQNGEIPADGDGNGMIDMADYAQKSGDADHLGGMLPDQFMKKGESGGGIPAGATILFEGGCPAGWIWSPLNYASSSTHARNYGLTFCRKS